MQKTRSWPRITIDFAASPRDDANYPMMPHWEAIWGNLVFTGPFISESHNNLDLLSSIFKLLSLNPLAVLFMAVLSQQLVWKGSIHRSLQCFVGEVRFDWVSTLSVLMTRERECILRVPHYWPRVWTAGPPPQESQWPRLNLVNTRLATEESTPTARIKVNEPLRG